MERIVKTLGASHDYEIVFVDDSTDAMPGILARLSHECTQVKYVHMENGTVLISAVLEGFRQVSDDWFIVMDADLHHPPEVLPDLIREIRETPAKIIIPSRFVPGGSDGRLSANSCPGRLVPWLVCSLAKCGVSLTRRADFFMCGEVWPAAPSWIQ